MKCKGPITIKLESGDRQTVACGNCMPCRVNKAQEWAFRLEQEMEVCHSAHFLTLTYSDEEIVRNDLGHGVLVKSDLQKFIKRLRRHVDRQEKTLSATLGYHETVKIPQIRYYAVGEYGGQTYRPHYHAIAFNIPSSILQSLESIWKHGHARIGTVTRGSILYCTKYITKIDTRDLEAMELPKPFQIMSNGIGATYVTDETREYHSRYRSLYTIEKKYSQRIGKYLENKIHTSEEMKQRVSRAKQRNALLAEKAQHEKERKLRDSGIDVYLHEREQERAQEATFRKNNKRNKL